MTIQDQAYPTAADAPAGWSGVFDIYVEEALAGDITESLACYVADLEAEGYAATVHPFSGTAEELRLVLRDRWETGGLEGALLVGDLPHVEFTSIDDFTGGGEATYLHDLYFMDLDGTYDMQAFGPDSHTGDVAPEIYVSRLAAGNLGGISEAGEAALINDYFAKLHAVRSGALQYDDRGTWFADDDWSANAGDTRSLATMYDTVTDIRAPAETTRAGYIEALESKTETLVMQIHSWAQGHVVSGENGGIITSADIAGIDVRAGFLNLWNCGSADFSVPDNLMGAYLFLTDGVVNAVGSTKTGSMLNFADFYRPQAAGDSMGQAFLQWFTANAAPTDDPARDWMVDWHYGMLMQGDPTLRPALLGPDQAIAAASPAPADACIGAACNDLILA